MKKVLLPAVLALGLLGVSVTGHAATFENYTTAIQGKILSVGVHNATTNQWYDVALNEDINHVGQKLTGHINVSELAPGTYDRIRYGHEKFKVQGKIVLKGDTNGRDGEYVTTGDGDGLEFKKGGQAGWVKPTSNQNSNEKEALSSLEKEGVAGYQENGINYEMTAINFVVSEKDGKKVAEGAYKTNITFDTSGLWSGAGWPASPNRYKPIDDAKLQDIDNDNAEYTYLHNERPEVYTWQKRNDGGEYLIPPFFDPPEIDLEKNDK